MIGRSFLVQASWNFERLQNLGFLFMVAPGLRWLYPPEQLAGAFHRHLEYFNTHPFMASPLAGATLALEEDHLRTSDAAALDAREFKRMVMAPYAAMGDALFWGGLRPLAAMLALFLAAKGSLWAPVIFLFLFNLPHLWFRAWGFLGGYVQGMKMVETIQRRHLPDLAIRIKETTIVLAGGLCAYLTFQCLGKEMVPIYWGLGGVPAVVALGWLARRGSSPLLLVMSTVALLLAILKMI